MKICEDCIKQDVCRYKKQVEGYEDGVKLPKPLEPIIQCKYKRTEPSTWRYTLTGDNNIALHANTTTDLIDLSSNTYTVCN